MIPTIEEIMQSERITRSAAATLHASMNRAVRTCGDSVASLTPEEISEILDPVPSPDRYSTVSCRRTKTRRAIRILHAYNSARVIA